MHIVATTLTYLIIRNENHRTDEWLPLKLHWYHTHKKSKDSLETRAVLIEISMLCSTFLSGPKHRGPLQKKHGFP